MATVHLLEDGLFFPPEFLGNCAYANRWVYFPNGYIFDIDLNCWFRTTLPHGVNYPFWFTLVQEGRVFALGNEIAEGNDKTGPVHLVTTWYNQADMERANSYSFTLPLIYQPTRDVVLREVELHLQTFAETSAVDVTITRANPDTGEDESFDLPQTEVEGVGKHPVRIQLGRNPGSANATWWKVRVTISSVPGTTTIEALSTTSLEEPKEKSVEAPMLERLLLGWQEGTRYKVGA